MFIHIQFDVKSNVNIDSDKKLCFLYQNGYGANSLCICITYFLKRAVIIGNQNASITEKIVFHLEMSFLNISIDIFQQIVNSLFISYKMGNDSFIYYVRL